MLYTMIQNSYCFFLLAVTLLYYFQKSQTYYLLQYGSNASMCYDYFPKDLTSHATFVFCNGSIYVNTDILISDAIDISLQSLDDSHTNLVCAQSTVGLSFFNVTNLHISNITFDGCGLILGTKDVDYTYTVFIHHEWTTNIIL